MLECRHRQHAHVEDRIRDDKDTGLAKFPFKEFALNEVWRHAPRLQRSSVNAPPETRRGPPSRMTSAARDPNAGLNAVV
jgi:hypothetical protein